MITAVFTSGFDHTEVSGLWQYDYGQKLRIQGLNLPPAVEIHFSLSKSGGDSESRVGVTRDGVTDVPIPDSMLENGGTIQNYYIYAFIYLTDKDSGKTVKWIQLHVNSRPKPEAFDSPEEAELFRDAIAAVNDSANRAETAEKSSEAWAHGHNDYPERDGDNAKFYSDKAREKAEETASNLQEVNNLANQVKENAGTVANDKNAVEEFKNKAGESAENAAVSESNAALHENNAKEAQTKAETAQRIAEEAKEQVAKDKEEVLIAKTAVEKSEKNVTENKEFVRQTVENFTSLAENAVDNVNVAGQNQVNNIEKAGQAALDNISTGVDESLTQSGKAADAKVTGDKIAGLEHDVEELNDKKITKFYASNLGNTNLQDSDSGKITDMMLYGKSEQKRYSGKNLCNVTLKDQTISGVTFKVNEDKSITVNGICTNDININIGVALLDANVEYKISGCPKFTEWNDAGFYVNANALSGNVWDRGETSTFIMPNTQKYICTIQLRKDVVLNNIIFYPMIRPSSITDSTYEPYVGGIPSPNPDYPQEIKSVVNPVVKVIGGNLINPGSGQESIKNRGITFTINSDKSITINGTNDGSGYSAILLNSIEYFEIGDIISTGLYGDKEDGNIYLDCYFVGDIYLNRKVENKKVDNNLTHKVFLCVKNGATVDNVTVKAMRNYGATLFPYEPYKEQTATLPYTLNAIPVSSGGNVTIDGQEYIADYVDVDKKQLVRMVGDILLNSLSWTMEEDGNVFISNDFNIKHFPVTRSATILCNKYGCKNNHESFDYTWNNVIYNVNGKRIGVIDKSATTVEDFVNLCDDTEIIYPLATQTEIDLTDEEVQAFKDLATYYQTTNVFITSDQLDGYTEFNYPLNMKNGWDYVMQQIEETRPIIYDTEVKVLENRIDTAILTAMMEG